MPPLDQSNIIIPRGRLRSLFQYRASLYAPAALAPISLTDEEAQDTAFETQPRYTNVPGWYEETPEFTNTALIGLTKEENVFTSDKWHFLSTQEINDAWLIVMTACTDKTYTLIGRAWVTQGNSEVNAAIPGRPAGSLWVYAKLSPTSLIPGGT